MHMKTLLLAGLLASPLALASPPEGEPMDRFIEHVNNRADLDLTDAQKAQIRTIGEEQRKKHERRGVFHFCSFFLIHRAVSAAYSSEKNCMRSR